MSSHISLHLRRRTLVLPRRDTPAAVPTPPRTQRLAVLLHVRRADVPLAPLAPLALLALAAVFAFTAPGSNATHSATRTVVAGHPTPATTTTAGTNARALASVGIPAEPGH
jgi:hypothetical protein